MEGKPFAIIGVNSDRDLDGIRSTVKEKSITWRSFWNGELGTRGPISKAWKVTGWPTTYLIDKDGVIRYKGLRGNALDQAIEELMAEMGEEVELVGVDHEAEDAEALKQAKEKAEAAKKAAAKLAAVRWFLLEFSAEHCNHHVFKQAQARAKIAISGSLSA
jgi:hypothetical protein